MMGTGSARFSSLAELLEWCRQSPSGTLLDAQEVGKIVDFALTEQGQVAQGVSTPESPTKTVESAPTDWREGIWTVPAETRLGVQEVAEALGKGKSWVYERTGPSAEDPIPHRKLDGVNVFAAGELRAWIRSREEVIHAGPMESTMDERKGKLYAL